MIHVTCYGPDQMVEKHHVSVDQLVDLRGKHPVMWVEATGFGDAEVIRNVGEAFDLHHLSLEDMVTVPQRS